MLSEKFEKNFLILELPYNIGICTNIAHANSLNPPNLSPRSDRILAFGAYLMPQ